MKNHSTLHLVTFTLYFSTGALAEVTLDGTLGKSGALPGPNYQISADVGQQHGSNLFHSFQDFNLQSHESATFSGPDNVQNIISRVTGGNPSSIDGTLRSTIPNADLYFLNPSGIMFGPNAKLDVQGGFHASTADTLRLQDGGQVNARVPNNSLLTVAPPTAFGFLTDAPGTIQVQDAKLSVSEGKTLSLIGGKLQLQGSTQPVASADNQEPPFDTEVSAPFGRINLASVASRGEVIPSQTTLELAPVLQPGEITIKNTKINTSGKGGGHIFIRSGQIELSNSIIANNTLGDQPGGTIDVQAQRMVSQSAEISANTYGTGSGGAVFLNITDTFTASGIGLYGFGNILRSTSGNWEEFAASDLTVNSHAGPAGQIVVEAHQIVLSEGAYLDTSTYGSGNGGTITVKADTLTISGKSEGGYSTGLFSVAEAGQTGNAGTIEIEVRQLDILAGGIINTATAGAQNRGGDLVIRVNGTLTLSGKAADGAPGCIYSGSTPLSTGEAGNIEIVAQDLILRDGGQISAKTEGAGKAGAITIKVANAVTISSFGVDSSALLAIGYDDASGIFSRSHSSSENAGNAGPVFIQANRVQLTDGGEIATSTVNAGGGDIIIITPHILYLRNGTVATSVNGGSGNSGNLLITSPAFVILDKTQIVAQANEGHGGNIRIIADQFLKTPDSLVSASSRLGIDGQVWIDSPDQTIGDSLLASPTEFTDLTGLLPRLCENMSFEEFLNRSTFYVYPIAGSTLSPYDLKPSLGFRLVPKLSTVGQASVKERTREGRQRVAWLTGCHS